MRLIDADALKEKFRTDKGADILGHSVGRLVKADAMINAAPTIDAAPVVHGLWIRRGNEKKCSSCHFIYYSNNDDFNYCPNCGAKMYK